LRSFKDLALALPSRRRDQPAEDEFWALRDVSFAIEPGEAVGFIGPNGAGKSTLLKLITGILEPTWGDVEIRGQVGALLELGAGFHPDLSGRENIYLNGSILGLGRGAIREKMTSIVSFAELERFIDMPVKHYSSGMYVRLGFSIAVHTEPDILLIDEVLAVGDQNFQHKCLERIFEMKRQGITICFVSHDLGNVRRLCSRAFWLEDGRVEAEGDVDDALSAYLAHAAEEEEARLLVERDETRLDEEESSDEACATEEEAEDVEITALEVLDETGRERLVFPVDAPWVGRLTYTASCRVREPAVRFIIHRDDGLEISRLTVEGAECQVAALDGRGEIR
jgi:ABC-type polysaccharide/polyol phosphate transport system ATPase subunit